MNGFRNSSRNGQVWCWQRAGSRAVILEVSGRRMEADALTVTAIQSVRSAGLQNA